MTTDSSAIAAAAARFNLPILAVFQSGAERAGGSAAQGAARAELYLKGREPTTMKTYETQYKHIAKYARSEAKSVFMAQEDQVIDYIMFCSSQGVSEGLLAQRMAVINMICEVGRVPSPTQAPVVAKVRLAAIKGANLNRRKTERSPMTVELLTKIIKNCFKEAGKVQPERRRFLLMQMFCFLGVRRFGDINQVRIRDVSVKADGTVAVWVASSKTDKRKQGFEFTITKETVGGITAAQAVGWYTESLGDAPDDGFFFPIFQAGQPQWTKAVTYRKARDQLIKERQRMNLGNVTWHSGRIGAATEAAKKGVPRNVIQKSGNWKSDAVDIYMRVAEPGALVGDALLAHEK
jgi:hypothetical protein